MLSVKHLSVSYGAVQALTCVDLTVGPGEVVGLLGPNGAGKTSLLRAVSQLVSYQGSISFDGVEIDGFHPDDVARQGIIHVPEGRHVFPTLTVHENLQIGLAARSKRKPGYQLGDVYELFPVLAKLRNRGGWALSGGEQQMVAIGRALVAAPRLLLLDEPSLGLAPIVAKDLFRTLRAIAETIPMLIVEQNTTIALRVVSRGYVLAGGRVVLAGSASELGNRRALISSYLGQHDLATIRSSRNHEADRSERGFD